MNEWINQCNQIDFQIIKKAFFNDDKLLRKKKVHVPPSPFSSPEGSKASGIRLSVRQLFRVSCHLINWMEKQFFKNDMALRTSIT